MLSRDQSINQQIQSKWEKMLQQKKIAQQGYSYVMEARKKVNLGLKNAHQQLRDKLRYMRKGLQIKIDLINQVHNHYNRQLDILNQGKKYQPRPNTKIHQNDLNILSIEMTDILKFQSLNKKKSRLENDFNSKCAKIKDEIKKVKLKISLTDMEINEAQKKSAKKSVKY